MSVSKPYCRLWRPLKGYNPLGFDLDLTYKDPDADLKYLYDDRFACQAEMASSVTISRFPKSIKQKKDRPSNVFQQ